MSSGGVLMVYHRPTRGQFVDASNVMENISAFSRHSQHPVWGLNVDLPTPKRLGRTEFDAIVLHYSVFLPTSPDYLLPPDLISYVAESHAYKIATFQDEYHHCQMRFDFIDRVGVDCVYTMLPPPHDSQVYVDNSNATRVVSNYPAYVGREVFDVADRFALPWSERTLDISYRGRPMPAYMGRGAQEKREIGERFAEAGAGSGMTIDIGVGEEDRIYGDDWYRFVASSRATLGVESGVSCFDLEDEVREEFERLSAENGREPTLEEMERGALGRWDWKIPYQTLSPRNIEAAAFRVCQILYEGHYSGVMKPMRNYIPLRKDFSNFDEVVERFRDETLRREIAENAYEDLIASDRLSYEHLIAGFDQVLADAGVPSRRAAPRSLVVRRDLRPPHPLTPRERVIDSWQNLQLNHPAAWKAAWMVSRPLVVPFRALQRAVRRGRSF